MSLTTVHSVAQISENKPNIDPNFLVVFFKLENCVLFPLLLRDGQCNLRHKIQNKLNTRRLLRRKDNWHFPNTATDGKLSIKTIFTYNKNHILRSLSPTVSILTCGTCVFAQRLKEDEGRKNRMWFGVRTLSVCPTQMSILFPAQILLSNSRYCGERCDGAKLIRCNGPAFLLFFFN